MTANLKLGEVLTDSIVAKLQQYMPERALAINEFYGSSGTSRITAPKNEDYITGRVKSLAVTPAIYVLEGQTKFGTEGSHSLLTETEMLVYIFDSDQTGPLLARRLQRQVRAIIESIWDDAPAERLIVQHGPFAGQDSAFSIEPMRTIPGSVFEPEADDNWRGIYTIVFLCQQLEH